MAKKSCKTGGFASKQKQEKKQGKKLSYLLTLRNIFQIFKTYESQMAASIIW